jgi:flavin-dependent dehydrogenase
MPQECVLNRVKGARIYSPSGKMLELARSEDQAYVIDRSIFDKSLAEGLNIEYGKQVSSIDFQSKVIVGADGPNSRIAELTGFSGLGERIAGMQYEIPIRNYNRDFVEMYFGNSVAPGFFAWIVPAGEKLRVGLAAKQNLKEHLDKFLKMKFPNAEILATHAGVIPLSLRNSFVKGNIALVGDSAGQVKATTGGGIVMGFKSALHLAKAIKENNLQKYEKYWKTELKRDFNLNKRIRGAIRSVSDKEMEKIWNILLREDVKKLFVEYGDMDHPTKLLKGVLRNLQLVKFLPYFRYLCR